MKQLILNFFMYLMFFSGIGLFIEAWTTEGIQWIYAILSGVCIGIYHVLWEDRL